MGVTFADTGAAWDSTEEAKFSDFSSGAGLGIRFVITGAMMLRLDYGYGFNEKLSVPGGRIHFNIGNIF